MNQPRPCIIDRILEAMGSESGKWLLASLLAHTDLFLLLYVEPRAINLVLSAIGAVILCTIMHGLGFIKTKE